MNHSVINTIKYPLGWLCSVILYPIAERVEKRQIRSKRAELRSYYKLDWNIRKKIMCKNLADIAEFAGASVPYYMDLFKKHNFQPSLLHKDSAYLKDLPFLTKDIVREHGSRLLSSELSKVRHHNMKTGGSTGLSANFIYDQTAADYSAAVTLFSRERIGKKKHKSELHFSCRFPDQLISTGWTRENWKELAMNRSNIFFGRLDDVGLEEMWNSLCQINPYLIHAHPSTIYALACYVQKTRGKSNAFKIFESSGELLQQYQRETIAEVLQCQVVDRYGLAEFGVIGFEINGAGSGVQVLDSEGWPESLQHQDASEVTHELVFTGFRNRLMPLLRYRTGDLATVVERENGFYLTDVVGRIHDLVSINGVPHPTHHIMDILDHRVGGIQEFQIDVRGKKPVLRLVLESHADQVQIKAKIESFWPSAFVVEFVGHDDFVLVGRHAKFRHVVNS